MAAPSPLWSGSSPLARGLHIGQPMLTREPRIIPARAGFTRTTTRPAARQRDHPRSRGVYDSVFVWVVYRHGSSPLARGLPMPSVVSQSDAGIIPARAGFTWLGSVSILTRGDHPRSRGVYLVSPFSSSVLPGSSPLARGLRLASQAKRGSTGIIPARAGFTALPSTSTR